MLEFRDKPILRFCCVWLLTSSFLLAADVPPEDVSVRIRSTGYECRLLQCRPITQFGSGTLVGRWRSQHAVLTCAHVLHQEGRHQVSVRDIWYEAEWIAGETNTDLAILVFTAVDEFPEAPLATRSPAAGTPIRTGGFPRGGPFRSRAGQVRGYVGTKPELTFAPPVEQGESGGGLFSDGALCGVIWGTDVRHATSYATPIEVIHAFLKRRNVILEASTPGAHPEQHPAQIESETRPPATTSPDNSKLFEPTESEPAPAPLPVTPPASPPVIHSPEPSKSGIPWTNILTAVATAFGLGTPVGLGIAALGWALKLRRRERSPPRDVGSSTATEYVPVAIDSPPIRQQAIPEIHFTPYETSHYPRAHAWARTQMARKYPGSVDLLETEQQLIKQFLAANPSTSSHTQQD